MTASFVFLLVVMVAVFVVALIVMGWLFGKSSAEQASVQQFQARLAKHLPPDVLADMKSGQLGRVTSVAIALVVLPIIVAGLITTGKSWGVALFVGGGLVGAVACAAWTASIAKTWLGRRNLSEVLADLSPYPLAGAVRRSFWLAWLMSAASVSMISIGGFQKPGGGPLLLLVVVLLLLLMNLMYSDRVWLAERGPYFGGRLYPWDGFERVAWTDDGRAFALRRRGRWRLQRWTVVPVPEGSREATEEALRQVLPAPTPTL